MRAFVCTVLLTLSLALAAAETAPSLRAQIDAGRYLAAIDAARERVQHDQSDTHAWIALGDALYATGQVDEAYDAYQHAARRDGTLRLDARVAIARIERVYRGDRDARDRLRDALDALHTSSGLDVAERIAAGHAARELARSDSSLFNVALEVYEDALESAPRDPRVHVAIGDLLLDRYNAEEAVGAYRAALKAEPSYAPAMLGLAQARHFDGSPGVREAAERALAANPNLVDGLALIATLDIEIEDLDAARSTLARAKSVNPRHPQALTLEAAIAFLAADGATFDETVARVRTEVPGYPRLFETLSQIAAQNRRYRRAADFALLAVTLDASAWRAHAMLGRNRLRLGDMAAGRDSLETAFRGDPYDPWTRNSLTLLDRLDDFEVVRSARFELVAERGEAHILARALLPIAERAYDFFSQAYGYAPVTPIRIEIYSRHEDFSVRTVGLTGIDIVGVSFGPVVAMDSPSAGVFGPLNYGAVLWHEIAHTFHLGVTESKVPRWFTEGLSVFEERRGRDGWGNDPTPAFLNAFRNGRLPSPSKLNEVFLRPSAPDALMHAYFLSSLLMDFIVEQHGFDAIVSMLESYRVGLDTRAAIERAIGISAAALDSGFDAYVRTRYSRALAALTPSDDAATAEYPRLLAEAYGALRAEDFARATTLFEQAQAMFPEHAGATSTYANLGALHERMGNTDAAIEQYRAGVAIDADDIKSLRRLIALYASAGRGDDAADAIDAALLIAPFDVALHRQLAELHESAGEWKRAAGAREAVVSLDQSDPAEARYLLARAQHRAGDRDAARSEVLKALEVAPMYDDALELLLEIREQSGAS